MRIPLYHYTCNHWAPHIEAEGLVKPSAVANGITKWTDARKGLPATLVAWLHSPPGVMPAHWWIATEPIPAVPANDRQPAPR